MPQSFQGLAASAERKDSRKLEDKVRLRRGGLGEVGRLRSPNCMYGGRWTWEPVSGLGSNGLEARVRKARRRHQGSTTRAVPGPGRQQVAASPIAGDRSLKLRVAANLIKVHGADPVLVVPRGDPHRALSRPLQQGRLLASRDPPLSVCACAPRGLDDTISFIYDESLIGIAFSYLSSISPRFQCSCELNLYLVHDASTSHGVFYSGSIALPIYLSHWAQ